MSGDETMRLRQALTEARAWIDADRTRLVKDTTLPGPDGEPDPSTMDDLARDTVARFDVLLARINAELGGAFGMAEEVERLQSELSMRLALGKARKQFEFYATQHRAKGTPDADAKAKVNDEMAAMCRAALGRPA